MDSLSNAYVILQGHTVKGTVEISAQYSAESFGQLAKIFEFSFEIYVVVVSIPVSVT